MTLDPRHKPILWTCTIGDLDLPRSAIPHCSDLPMRRAVEAAYLDVIGLPEQFTFSGWGQSYLEESRRAVVEHRNILDDESHHKAWERARAVIEAVTGPLECDPLVDERASDAVSALAELLWHRSKAEADRPAGVTTATRSSLA